MFGNNISQFNYERETDYPLFHHHNFLPNPNPCDPINICSSFPTASSFSLLTLSPCVTQTHGNQSQTNPTQDKPVVAKHVNETNLHDNSSNTDNDDDDDDDDDDDMKEQKDSKDSNESDHETQKRYNERFPYSEKSRHEQSVTFTFEHTLYTLCLHREKQQKSMKKTKLDNKRNYLGDMCLLDPRDRTVLLRTLLQHLTPEQIKLGNNICGCFVWLFGFVPIFLFFCLFQVFWNGFHISLFRFIAIPN